MHEETHEPIITLERILTLTNCIIDHMLNDAGGHVRDVIETLMALGFTGGEPMLHPEIIQAAVADIRSQTNAPIYLYTAQPAELDALMPLLDGVTVTLHAPEDIPVFEAFDRTARNLAGKSLRLNVFEEAGTLTCRPEWKVKDHMEWIPNCPLPEGEVLMWYQPLEHSCMLWRDTR